MDFSWMDTLGPCLCSAASFPHWHRDPLIIPADESGVPPPLANAGPARKTTSEGVRTFLHCPHCASTDLYRPNNVGNYECQTCGLEEISEALARRTQ